MAREGQILIRLENITKEFNGTIAVHNLNLEIWEGEFLCFLGPSGCGKTTTLRMIAGLERPTRGEIYLRGQRITDWPPQRRNIGFMFQNYALFNHMSVYENLAFGLWVRRVPREEIERRVRSVAQALELEPVLHLRASRLDLSTMQRVALARILVIEPQVLLLDEPLNNFRPGLRELMRAELKRWQYQFGRTMVYVTHDQEEAMTLGDRIVIMNAGHIEQVGTPDEVYQRPATLFVASFIGRPSMNLLPVEYRISEGRAFLVSPDFEIPVDDRREIIEKSHSLPNLILGVRPEQLRIHDPQESSPPDLIRIPAQVDLVRPQGRKLILDVKTRSGTLLQMVVPSIRRFVAGEQLEIAFYPHQTLLFDPQTGKGLC
ncbi:ABC transporter ATP-binding protein [Thermoflexus sp.]|uniref:ABC transporter ATP-binding protein n=1 Tax=Thermoflexus sp. TaxID=1969742 RepID=UPI0035E456A0